jgi:dephospho-CoA kinase
MTKIIGLTGGIGSGKTTIAKYFQCLGIPAYNSDEEARKLTDDPEIKQLIKQVFGKDIFDKEKLNRGKLAAIVFNKPEKLIELNSIIHPAVKKHFENWVFGNSKSRFVIKDAAILFESGSFKDCDVIITIIAPIEIRIQRVINRDFTFRENILKRINNQWNDGERVFKSQYVIENMDVMSMRFQAEELLKKLIILYD